MNAVGFQFQRLARFFGFRQEKKRLSILSRETQFLHEAIELLGRSAWEDTEDIEDVAVEYWKIRDLEKQQLELRRITEQLEQETRDLESRRVEIRVGFDEELEKLQDQKADAMELVADAEGEIEGLEGELDRHQRRYDGMELKLKAFSDEGSDTAQVRARMDETRSEIDRLRDQVDGKSGALRELEQSVFAVSQEMADKRNELRDATKDIFSEIGKKTKILTNATAKVGSLQAEKNDLAKHIGKYLSTHLHSENPEVQNVLSRHRPLVSRIAQFRRSIGYHQRLSSRG